MKGERMFPVLGLFTNLAAWLIVASCVRESRPFSDQMVSIYLDVPELLTPNIPSVVYEVRAKTLGGVEQTESASIIAKCAEAMGGTARIKDIRTLRAEVVYPDHDAAAILHEIRRPNLIRTERPGGYVAIFDGRLGAMLKYDPANPSQAPVPQDLPAEAA